MTRRVRWHGGVPKWVLTWVLSALCCAWAPALQAAEPAAVPAAPPAEAPAAAPAAVPDAAPAAASTPAFACPPSAPAEARAAPPRDRGLLWRIARDGRVSYLFGTLHVGKPGWSRFGPRTVAALRATDTLALEIDLTDPDLAGVLAEPGAPAELPPALRQQLARAFERACLPAAALASLHPLLQAATLTVLDARWLGLEPAFAQEQLLARRAHARRERVVSLETVAMQKSALLPDSAAQAQAMLEQTLEQLEDHSARRVLARLAAAWEQGDLATLEDYAGWCECVASDEDRAFMRHLNDERNPQLADGIEAQHRQGRRVFAAVGALHMTGPQALPRLLAARGFKVERIVFKR